MKIDVKKIRDKAKELTSIRNSNLGDVNWHTKDFIHFLDFHFVKKMKKNHSAKTFFLFKDSF